MPHYRFCLVNSTNKYLLTIYIDSDMFNLSIYN